MKNGLDVFKAQDRIQWRNGKKTFVQQCGQITVAHDGCPGYDLNSHH